jgi:CheY-like chemotaxis protein
MNGVIGMTGLLLDTPLTLQQQNYVETIRNCGDTLLTIINDILDFSKIESGKLTLEEQPFNLRTCIEESLDLLAPKATEKQLELLYHLSPDVPPAILGDVTRVRQILVNLLGNAIKFTEQGEVSVLVSGRQLRADESSPVPDAKDDCQPFFEIQVAVKDTGIGIPADRLDRLFQSFQQVDSSTTRKYGGTGLGLAISKRLCEAMGGKIWVESLSNQGSTFSFSLIAQATKLTTPTQDDDDDDLLKNKRVLIVDDNASNREILKQQLQSWQMRPCLAQSGYEAIGLLEQAGKFDLMIVDMYMPQLDGLALARIVRNHPTGQRLPLMMLTSSYKTDLGTQTQELGFSVVLNKPVRQSDLYQALCQTLSGQQASVQTIF